MSLLVQFWVISLLLALTPGADWAYVIAAGLRARSVTPSVVGILAGHAALIVLAALGVGATVAKYPLALTVLTVAGALYLLWAGVTTLVRPVEHVAASEASMAGSARGQFSQGMGISAINPKGLLLLLALLPQFTSPHAWPESVQMLILGSAHLANCAVVYFTVGHFARRVLRASPKATMVVTKFAGAAMGLIGIGILAERIMLISS